MPSIFKELSRRATKHLEDAKPFVVTAFQVYTGTQDTMQRGKEVELIKTCLDSLMSQMGKQNYTALFANYLSGLGLVAQIFQAYQGDAALAEVGIQIKGELEAQTGLQAPYKFARQVHLYIAQRTEESTGDDFFFVYHPDTNWHAEFFHRMKTDPLPTNFLGLSSNLDTLCIWMKFLRSIAPQVKGKSKPNFHILVPAYRPLVIKEPLTFPEELFPLTVEGHIYNSVPLIWLNVPNVPEGRLQLNDVGNLAAPPTALQEWRKSLTTGTLLTTWTAGLTANILLTAAAAATMPVLTPVVLLGGGAAVSAAGLMAAGAVKKNLEVVEPRMLGGSVQPSEEIKLDKGTRRVKRKKKHDH